MKISLLGFMWVWLSLPFSVWSEDYGIDIEGMHAAIDFRIQHLGYSWMSGRFNKFEGHLVMMKITLLLLMYR